MNSGLLRTITPNEVGTYHRDGVLLLSGMFDKDWIELLNKIFLEASALLVLSIAKCIFLKFIFMVPSARLELALPNGQGF